MRVLLARYGQRMPARFKTPAQVARFKRAQREFDQVVLDLNLASPTAIQARNSLVPSRAAVRLIGLPMLQTSSSRAARMPAM